MSFFPTEPSADARQGAKAMREFYVALLNEGFSEEQVLFLLAAMLTRGKGQAAP